MANEDAIAEEWIDEIVEDVDRPSVDITSIKKMAPEITPDYTLFMGWVDDCGIKVENSTLSDTEYWRVKVYVGDLPVMVSQPKNKCHILVEVVISMDPSNLIPTERELGRPRFNSALADSPFYYYIHRDTIKKAPNHKGGSRVKESEKVEVDTAFLIFRTMIRDMTFEKLDSIIPRMSNHAIRCLDVLQMLNYEARQQRMKQPQISSTGGPIKPTLPKTTVVVNQNNEIPGAVSSE